MDVLLRDSPLASERIYLSIAGSRRASYMPNVMKLQLPWSWRLIPLTDGWCDRFRYHTFRPNAFWLLFTRRLLLGVSLYCDIKDLNNQSRNIIHPLQIKLLKKEIRDWTVARGPNVDCYISFDSACQTSVHFISSLEGIKELSSILYFSFFRFFLRIKKKQNKPTYFVTTLFLLNFILK